MMSRHALSRFIRQSSYEAHMDDGRKNYVSQKATVHETSTLEAPVRIYDTAVVRKYVKIGSFTFLNKYTTAHSGSVIGRYCSIGKSVEIGAFDHPVEYLSTSSISYNLAGHFPNEKGKMPQLTLRRAKGPVIGNDVWIGSGVIIKRGVTIGDGAIIGGGAFVSKDVAPYEIVGGIPAKHLRFRFDPDTIAELLALKWWDLPFEQVARLPFDNVAACIEMLREIRGSSTDSVPAQDERRGAFVDLLCEKIYDADGPQALIDLVRANASTLYIDYDTENPAHVFVLNTKLAAILEMLTDAGGDIDPKAEQRILRTLRSGA